MAYNIIRRPKLSDAVMLVKPCEFRIRVLRNAAGIIRAKIVGQRLRKRLKIVERHRSVGRQRRRKANRRHSAVSISNCRLQPPRCSIKVNLRAIDHELERIAIGRAGYCRLTEPDEIVFKFLPFRWSVVVRKMLGQLLVLEP